jgi:signal transduction histidine kinase/DNA-binding response OmpR family regulator
LLKSKTKKFSLVYLWNKSILFQLVAAFVLLSFLTISVVCYTTYTQAKDSLKDSVFQRLNLIAALKEKQLNIWFFEQAETFLSFQNLPIVQQETKEVLINPYKQIKSLPSYPQLQAKFLSFLKYQSSWSEIFLTTREGRVILSTKGKKIEQFRSIVQFSEINLDQFEEINLNYSEEFEFNFYRSPSNGNPIITLSYPIFNNNQSLGILAVNLNLSRIDQIIGNAKTEEKDKTYLVANIGSSLSAYNVIISAQSFSDEKFSSGINSEGIKQAMLGENGEGLYLNYQGIPVIGVYRWLDKQDVALIVEIEQKLAFQPAKKLAQLIILMGLVFTGISAIAIYLIAKKITTPIMAITQAATQLSKRNLLYQALVLTENEIGILARTFNQMTTELRVLYSFLENKVEERTKALKAINQQLEAEITQRKQAELAIQEAKEAAEIANQAKSRFLATMSHELRTPLHAILGFTQLLLRDSEDSVAQQDKLKIIQRSGEHLLELINDVLDMSKIEAEQMTLNLGECDLFRLLDDLEQMLQLSAASKQLTLIFERSPQVPRYIQTDEKKLRQVLLNLLTNGIKFTPRGSVILEVNLISASMLEFKVKDTGYGISPEEIAQLFQPFMQTKIAQQMQQGTGLGLAISQKFVKLMGGEISVSSILGQGTVFKFQLQVTICSIAPNSSNITHQKIIGLASYQTKYRILVVEDFKPIRELLNDLLTSIGFVVKEAINGKEGIEIWLTWSPHLIIMDLQMPLINGYEATKYIRSHPQGQETVIIALTASIFDSQQQDLFPIGFDDLLLKPCPENILLTKIAQHLKIDYIYGDLINNYSPKAQEWNFLSLTHLPQSWLNQLNYFAAAADREEILNLLRELPDSEADLVKLITNLVNNFQFDQLINLIEKIK